MESKSIFVALVGKPNVGKSSLMNIILGEKIAIVTSKPQTTRTSITGILTKGVTQFVFMDTPGVHAPKTKLGEYMVKTSKKTISDVDLVLMLFEPYGEFNDAELGIIENIKSSKLPRLRVINKKDTIKSKSDGERQVRRIKVIVAEIVREKLLLYMRDEIPHGTNVEVEKFKDRPGKNIIDISVVIYCEKKSHKGMIIGKQGAMLKKIATRARTDIEEFLAAKVNMQCWVKVREDWRDSNYALNDFGFKDE